MLNRALHAFRLVTFDPYLQPVGRRQAIVARVGFGAGEEVAAGLWTAATELTVPQGRRPRARLLAPQARLAAVLGSREAALACEELALRARMDLDHGRPREAALQLLVALDAALAELSADPGGAQLAAASGRAARPARAGGRGRAGGAVGAADRGPRRRGRRSPWDASRRRCAREPPPGRSPALRVRAWPGARGPDSRGPYSRSSASTIAVISCSTSPPQRAAARPSYGVEPCVMIATSPPASRVIFGSCATG